MKTFCRVTIQLPLYQLKLKTIPLLHRRDHFVFTYVSQVCHVIHLMSSPLIKYHAEYDATLKLKM